MSSDKHTWLSNAIAVLVLSLVHGNESSIWLKKCKNGINAVEMRSIRRYCEVSSKIDVEALMPENGQGVGVKCKALGRTAKANIAAPMARIS
ncbi:hypothetical protein EVAR_62192_1 [Eumeta japonica]|uniref:Uncharacterized protein n=1 Tax=Eumeta variegata TaxID=151549 RepID=A0A4C1Z5E1_EUMVA|nr:hypothetical protein EVAR_62192_1 [Eumeta japonica]